MANWFKRQAGKLFSAASNGSGGGATPPAEETVKPVDTTNQKFTEGLALGQSLNNHVGGLLVDHKIVSKTVEENIGKIQAVARGVAIRYQEGSKHEKIALSKAGLITDNRDGGKQFNGGLLFDIAKDLGEATDLDEQITKLHAALTEKVQTVKTGLQSGRKIIVTDEDIAKGQASIDNRERNLPQGYPESLAIVPIYKALDKDIGQFAADIIPLHNAIRSGAARIAAGQPDKAAAAKTKKFNVLRLDDRDPPEIKKIVEAARRVNEHEIDPEKNPLNKEDLETLAEGVKTAAANFEKNAKALADKGLVDASPLVEAAKQYEKFMRFVAKQAETTPTQKAKATQSAGISFDGDPSTTAATFDAAGLQEMLNRQEQPKKPGDKLDKGFQENSDGTNNNITDRVVSFHNALTQGFGSAPSRNFRSGIGNGNIGWLADTLDIVSAKPGQALFKDEDGHQFSVTPDKIEHIDNDDELSMKEALQHMSIAFQNPKAVQQGIALQGSERDIARYKVAYDMLKATYGKNNAPRLLNEKDVVKASYNTELAAAKTELGDTIDSKGNIDFTKMARPASAASGGSKPAGPNRDTPT